MRTRADRATIAAIAQGWIEEEAPPPLVAIMNRQVEGWRDSPAAPASALWLASLDVLCRAGAWEEELALCRIALQLDPHQPTIRLAMGRCLGRLGRDGPAQDALSSVPAPPSLRAEALLDMLRQGDAPQTVDEELRFLLLEEPEWGRLHAAWSRHLERREGRRALSDFVAAWTAKHTFPPGLATERAMLAMLMGRPAEARPLFAPLWQTLSDAHAGIMGRFDGHVPPYGPPVEAELAARIEGAFALPEDRLNRVVLADSGPRRGERVLLVTFGDRDLANDLAAHYGQTALRAGLDCHVLADTAIALPHEFRGSTEQIEARLTIFEAELARLRPAVVVLDCLPPLGLRGLNPGRMADLRRRHGFRLVGLMRDAHAGAMPLVRAWAPVCDTVLVDILSPAWSEAGTAEKAVPLVIPTQWGPYLEPQSRTSAMTFIGAINFQVRLALLSVLMTEIPGFRAVYGGDRQRQAPDMASYAKILAQSGAVVNLSIHGTEDHLVTSRVWETLATGSLLVEQDNPGTGRFLTPWRHYLPWSTVGELVHLGHFIASRPDLAVRVAEAGRAWAARHYSPDAVWGGILAHALRPRSEPERRAEEVMAGDWQRFVFAAPGRDAL